jgi:hypothetical protein
MGGLPPQALGACVVVGGAPDDPQAWAAYGSAR